ncbi:hypothetical protein T492DRAFT_833300 [Pavlovales sp. CCMP2436]|nr:hypothetical protein T492DRAFT_833300 [Pavlovales sp. CCMP2436]|eukprot:CAMPEP_0179885316 /NCGR_PEP_ID=MMETSP0982-20121206/30205_1 /TAXON_ID=483367 /ORGANISM="non described non described, Strain CCMP 2436" /LENGTH=143 /DNA_ID=CAMNT_0021780867 /DNA_START=20 /DNA_END=451 /DNA_ORIENTATION=+
MSALLLAFGRAAQLPLQGLGGKLRAHCTRRLLSSRSREPAAPLDAEARAQVVQKLIEQREQLAQGRHRRRHFTVVGKDDNIMQKIQEYERTSRDNGMFNVKMKSDTRHTKGAVRRVLEQNAGRWRAFKVQLNDSLSMLLENRK